MSKQMSRRNFLRAAGMGTAGLALANYLPALAQDDLQATINYWHHFTSETEFLGMERVMALFAEKYPGVEVIQENIPNADFMAKFTSGVLAGERADTTMISVARLPDMVAMDGLVPLTDRINNWELKEYFPDNRWEGITVDGEIYGIPAFTFVDWGYYRTDWFEEAGIEPPQTFDEFLEAAIALTDPEQGRYGFGMRAGDGGQGFIIAVMEAFGTQIVDENGEPAIDRDTAIEAIKWYSDLYTVHNVVPESAPSDSYRQIMEGFKTGQTAMVWHHTGSLTEIAAALEPGEQFLPIIRPAGPVNHVARLSYLYNGVMKEDNIDAAWAWVSFWGELDPTIAFLEETGYFPASQEVAEDPRITENDLYTPALDTLAFGGPEPNFVGYSGWTTSVVLPEFQKVLVGEATVEQAVDAMIAGLEETLE
ncbi:MAG: sugar ABC transporter substrate-binding protein [Anaerolineaceae bacterium]|nr:sugar ABC transporter substrate-binding protein [Anaerolineaceae bacterium]